VFLADAALLWRRHRALAVADFRREYGLSVTDLGRLPAVEWVQLLVGLSHRSRLFSVLSAQGAKTAKPATVASVPRGKEQYLAALGRLRGKVNVRTKEQPR
jgi:hypothetical protein